MTIRVFIDDQYIGEAIQTLLADELRRRDVVVVGGGTRNLDIQIMRMQLTHVRTARAFRALVSSLAPMTVTPEKLPAPKFGRDRPYLKKKKGRS